MMYFTQLPDHAKPGFDEQAHFGRFKKHNMIFNALSRGIHCDNHVGCLSLKTVLCGEEWYGINHNQITIRPGQFLILNDDQTYSCHIDRSESVRSLSVFFKKEFASAVFHDALHQEEVLLNDPHNNGNHTLEFFQTLHTVDSTLLQQLTSLIACLEIEGYDDCRIDEYLVFLLHYLIKAHQTDSRRAGSVNAIKSSTRMEIYKRLSIAKDLLYTHYRDKPDLNVISTAACLSVPQLVRQFKAVFNTTPHQYLIRIRLQHAAELLRRTNKPVSEIAWACGFENVSAFCRAFKTTYKVKPGSLRKMS